MPEENVEIVRRVYGEWEKGNMRAGVPLFDPGIVLISFMPDSSERVVARGLAEIEDFLREFLAQWRDYRLLGDEFREVAADRVLVRGRQSAIGRLSGVAVEDETHSVWTFRDGKVVELRFERELQRALETLADTP